MKRYLCIDTNIFIQCCLLELEGDNIDALKQLHKLLDESKVYLLLPEVIELEFYKKLQNKVDEIEQMVGKHKANINKDNFDDKIKKDLLSKLDSVLKERERNASKVLKEIGVIFSHKNTFKIGLSTDIFIDAYKSFLRGEKPYKSNTIISQDCLIIQSLKYFLKDKADNPLYLCSLNTEDFAKNKTSNISQTHNPEIHPDVKKMLTSIQYYTNLFSLLNEQFDQKYTSKEIEKLKEKEIHVDSFLVSSGASIKGEDDDINIIGNLGLVDNTDILTLESSSKEKEDK